MRFVVELKPDKITATNVLPGFNQGYFENNEKYDQMPLWLHNKYRPMPFYLNEVRSSAVQVVNFIK